MNTTKTITVALFAVIAMMGIGVITTTQQNAQAFVTTGCMHSHTFEWCIMHDLKKTVENGLNGLTDNDN